MIRQWRDVDFLGLAQIGSVSLPNPVLLASGTAGHGTELAGHVRYDVLGGLVVKSLYHSSWPGNPPPRLAPVEFGMLNSVGLQGPGVSDWKQRTLPALIETGIPVIASIWGRTVEDYRRAAAMLAMTEGVTALEVNLSCPNIEGRETMFAHDPNATAEVLRSCAVAGVPLWAKLSANTDRLVDVARTARDNGAEAVTLINTMLGLHLDPHNGRRALGGGGGGLSGPAIRPIAVRAIWDVHAALPDLPLIGVGGVRTGRDALEMMRAGASVVQVGTSSFARPSQASIVLREAARRARKDGHSSWSTVVGSAHRPPRDR